jgi:uncharacterized membrane protein YkoI
MHGINRNPKDTAMQNVPSQNQASRSLYSRIIPLLAFTAVLVLGSWKALAVDAEEIKLFREAKITLSEAIAAAEKHQPGKAVEAGLDDDSFTPTYEVNILTQDSRAYDVRVDAVSGKVIGSREDIDD